MPELPEVEVVRAGLATAINDSFISQIEVFDARSLKRHRGSQESFTRELVGQRLRTPVRRGKFLWIPMNEHRALLAHLGMSGQLLLRSTDQPDDRHVRVRLSLENPQFGEIRLDFADQRMFGSLAVDDLVPTSDGAAGGFGSSTPTLPSQALHIARDALDPNFSQVEFRNALRHRRAGIKKVLLDQGLISGIGNIYADESLWSARIHPDTPSHLLSSTKIRALLSAVTEVFHRALAEGGTSFDAQYVNVNGQAGYFAHSLNAYGREGKPCPRCGKSIVRRPFMNRSSHYCPRCQKLAAPRIRNSSD